MQKTIYCREESYFFMKAIITDLKHFAVHDGPGIRTTVFFKGCPLKCLWCHNPENISFEPQTAFYKHKCVGCKNCEKDNFVEADCLGEARVRYGKEVSVEELLPSLLEDKDFYETSGGGVTLSGGECLCQADFCAELLKALKENGIHTAVDTCGFVSRQSLDKVLPFVDIFLYDVKAIDEQVHIKCTGQSNVRILENLEYIDKCGKAIEIRIPYVPDFNDGEIAKISKFLKPLKNIVAVKVLPYHNYAGSKYEALGMENTLPERLPSEEEIKKAQELFNN